MSKTKSENIVPDDLILCRKNFKKSLPGQTVNVMGKDYATVAHRVAVVRECLGGRASITSEILHNDKDTCVVRTTFTIDGKVVSTGLAEEKEKCQQDQSNFCFGKLRNICSWKSISNGWYY